MPRGLIRFLRASLLAVHVLLGLLLGGLTLTLPPLRRQVPALRSWWLMQGVAILGIRVIACGRPARGLMLANHLSWVDILVLATQSRSGFVAKAEMARWPLLGWLAQMGGTEFVRRGSHDDVKRVLARMVARLEAGESLTLFPEGTSTGSTLPLRFRPRLLQAAVDAGVPVQPVALYYGTRLSAVAFVGEDSFLCHLWRLLAAEPVLAEVNFLPELASRSGDCRLLADESWRAVTHALTRLERFEREAVITGDEGLGEPEPAGVV
ncbi:MAG TPA: lysophospholipid acyltransferase family protein [Gammaproteobacteria bacterium]